MKPYQSVICGARNCPKVLTIGASFKLSKLTRVFLLAILFVCALSINGCDATEATPYPILDSGFGSDKQQVYWLDDDHVLFGGYEGDKPKTIEEKENVPWGLYIWNVKNNTVWLFARNGHHYCYHNGKIYYAQDFKKIYWVVDWENTKKTGEVRPERMEIEKVDYLRMDCLRGKRPPGTEGRAIIPLLERHGHLDEGQLRGSISKKNTPIVYYRFGENNGIVLPVGRREVRRVQFIDFQNAYLLSGSFYNEDKGYAESWPAGVDRPIWWLYPDGKIEKILIPFKHSRLGSSVSFFGTKKGLFITSHAVGRDSGSSGNAGGYLLHDDRLVEIVKGIIDGTAVSPSGCNVAFSYVQNVMAMRPGTAGRRTMQVIELCKI